jgi:hypothetical protein
MILVPLDDWMHFYSTILNMLPVIQNIDLM